MKDDGFKLAIWIGELVSKSCKSCIQGGRELEKQQRASRRSGVAMREVVINILEAAFSTHSSRRRRDGWWLGGRRPATARHRGHGIAKNQK